MTTPLRRCLALLTAVLALAAGLTLPSYAEQTGSGAAARSSAQRAPLTQVQRVRVSWQGTSDNPDYVNSAVVPGIGSLDLICRPNDTRVRLYTDRRGRETQMWLQKYETKNGRAVVAVKTPRIYQYAHAEDDGRGGTGYYAHEGLNQVPGVENRSQGGYMHGVISQRSSRAAAGAQVASPLPVTTFELDWNWNGFDHPQRYRSCTIDATITTQYPADQRTVLTWRGWEPAPQETLRTALPGIGWLHLSCPTDTELAPTVWIDPYSEESSLYLEDVRGEGAVADQRTTTTRAYDPATGLLGPYPLPSNGTLRMRVLNGEASRWLMLSSYWVTNDRWGPGRNVCELAAGAYNR